MLYEEPACRSSACATHVGSRTISSKIARFTASPMEMPFGSDAIARSASMRPLSAVSVSAGTVAAVTSAAFSRPIAGFALRVINRAGEVGVLELGGERGGGGGWRWQTPARGAPPPWRGRCTPRRPRAWRPRTPRRS